VLCISQKMESTYEMMCSIDRANAVQNSLSIVMTGGWSGIS
jgi:hypothetical protein